MRMLAGIVAGQPFASEMIGDESLSRRPMKRIMEPLTQMGAEISATDDHAPLRITGTQSARASIIAPPVASAQVKTCLLFAGLLAEGHTTVDEPMRTRDHGELALRAFGAKVERTQNAVSIARRTTAASAGGFQFPATFRRPRSSCARRRSFPESNLVIDGVLLNPTRSALLDVLAAMGCRDLHAAGGRKSRRAGGHNLMVAGSGRQVVIAGAQTARSLTSYRCWRRLLRTPPGPGSARCRRVAGEGVGPAERGHAQPARPWAQQVEQTADGWRIPGGQKLHGAEIESHSAIIASPWRSPLRPCGPRATRSFAVPDVLRFRIPAFSSDLEQVVER